MLNPKAKTYKSLRKKQAEINKMLYASEHIAKDNAKRKRVLAMKQQFFKSRGIKNPSKLSFKNLSKKDLKAYKELLASIENDTYVNPKNYSAFQDKMRKIFEESHYGFNYEDVKDVFESDIGDELKELGLPYKDFWETYSAVTDDYGNVNVNSFIEMLKGFKADEKAGNFSLEDFYVYADAWFGGYIDESYDVYGTELSDRLKENRDKAMYEMQHNVGAGDTT